MMTTKRTTITPATTRPAAIARPAATAGSTTSPVVDQIRKVAVISHDYNTADGRGRYDYSEHFVPINRLCDEQGGDTILYAPYTLDRDSPVVVNHDVIFGELDSVQRVVFEVGTVRAPGRDKNNDGEEVMTYVWSRAWQAPLEVTQFFALSKDSKKKKMQFINDLLRRRFANAVVVSCGESNIATMAGHEHFTDVEFRFNDTLAELNINLVLNPVHDWMQRREMKEKRRGYSRDGRTVISVWNKGISDWNNSNQIEDGLPWTVHHDDEERTEAVRELPNPFSDRGDIRIGILDLGSL